MHAHKQYAKVYTCGKPKIDGRSRRTWKETGCSDDVNVIMRNKTTMVWIWLTWLRNRCALCFPFLASANVLHLARILISLTSLMILCISHLTACHFLRKQSSSICVFFSFASSSITSTVSHEEFLIEPRHWTNDPRFADLEDTPESLPTPHPCEHNGMVHLTLVLPTSNTTGVVEDVAVVTMVIPRSRKVNPQHGKSRWRWSLFRFAVGIKVEL